MYASIAATSNVAGGEGAAGEGAAGCVLEGAAMPAGAGGAAEDCARHGAHGAMGGAETLGAPQPTLAINRAKGKHFIRQKLAGIFHVEERGVLTDGNRMPPRFSSPRP